MTTIANVSQLRTDAVLKGAAPAVSQTTRLRLTRRGRVVFGGLASVLIAGVFAIVAMFSAPGAVASNEQTDVEFPYVLAQPGESLWSIAADLDPTADTREVVSEIAALNQLQGAEVQAGDALAVPMRFEESPYTFSASEIGL